MGCVQLSLCLPCSRQQCATKACLQDLHVTGLDPNPGMLPFALEAARRAGLQDEKLSFQLGVAQDLKDEPGTYDAVVSTLVCIPFCAQLAAQV